MKGLYLAADQMSQRRCNNLLKRFGNRLAGIKVHRLYDDARAKELVASLKSNGAAAVWADLKLHDTPDTVKDRALGAKLAGADFVTVHASGGQTMMQAAVETGIGVYAVLYLTSLTDKQVSERYTAKSLTIMIDDAMKAGVAGFICPPTKVAEWRRISADYDRSVDLVVPGTRFPDGQAHDQQQVGTPAAAANSGADYLVIGRMLTAANNPNKVMDRLLADTGLPA